MLTNLTPKTPSQTRSRNSVLKPLNLLSRMNMEETEVIQNNLKDHANEVFKNENIEFNQRPTENPKEHPKILSNCNITSGKRFNCPHCDLYSRNSRLKVIKHIKKKHFPNFEFKCFYCKESCDEKMYLRLHIRYAHPGNLKAVMVELKKEI